MNLERLAEQQLADYDRRRPGMMFAGNAMAMTVEEAYALQFAVADLRVRRGERIAGYKVGCLSAAIQAQLGLESPVFGHVFHTEVHESGVVLRPEEFDGLAIEGEFAVRMACDAAEGGWLRRHAEEAVASWFAVIELHNYVFRNSPHSAQELIGNNALHAGAVLPPGAETRRGAEGLEAAVVQVRKNGVVVGTSEAAALPGGPLGSLERLAAHLNRYGRRLRQGDMVLTGSPLPLYRVANGDVVEVSGGGGGAGPVSIAIHSA